MIDTGEGRARHETWEYVPAEYLSHDAPGYSQLLSAGGILATDSEGEVYWVIEGEIEPKIGKRIVAAVNHHDELVAALGVFLNQDPRFQIAMAGNPRAIDAMLAKLSELYHRARAMPSPPPEVSRSALEREKS